MFRQNFIYFSLQLSLVSPLGISAEFNFIFFSRSRYIFVHIDKIPPSPFSPCWRVPATVIHYSHKTSFGPLSLWPCAEVALVCSCHLFRREQSCAQSPQSVSPGVKRRGRTRCLNLQATLLLMQTLFAAKVTCCSMVSLSPRNSRFFSADLLSSPSLPTMNLCWKCPSSPDIGVCIFIY